MRKSKNRKAFIENYGAIKHNEEESFFGVREEFVEEKKPTIRYGREGQDEYRRKLLEECPLCPTTMINEESLLIASHINPWAVSDSKERIDPNNGFIFHHSTTNFSTEVTSLSAMISECPSPTGSLVR